VKNVNMKKSLNMKKSDNMESDIMESDIMESLIKSVSKKKSMTMTQTKITTAQD